MDSTERTKCGFAHAGTYGHECGKPADRVAVKASTETTNRLFFIGRCDDCAKIVGGENRGVLRLEPFNPDAHRNLWR